MTEALLDRKNTCILSINKHFSRSKHIFFTRESAIFVLIFAENFRVLIIVFTRGNSMCILVALPQINKQINTNFGFLRPPKTGIGLVKPQKIYCTSRKPCQRDPRSHREPRVRYLGLQYIALYCMYLLCRRRDHFGQQIKLTTCLVLSQLHNLRLIHIIIIRYKFHEFYFQTNEICMTFSIYLHIYAQLLRSTMVVLF